MTDAERAVLAMLEDWPLHQVTARLWVVYQALREKREDANRSIYTQIP